MKVKVTQGDITEMKTDGIVNAANSSLMGGGGVDGAIHSAGGPKILEECKVIRDTQGKCPVGEAVMTTAGDLPSDKVIHTVGPRWKGGNNNEEETLKSCYLQSLKLAEENNLKSIAFPNVSTGVYGFPKEKAAEIAIEAVRNYDSDTIDEVTFVCFDDKNYNLYKERL